MMNPRFWVAGLVVTACAGGGGPPAEPAPAPEPEAVAKPAASTETPTPTSEADGAAPEKPVPPLSTPNKRPTAASDAGAAASRQPDVPHVEPQQLALRRAGEAAQACYDQSKLPRGTAGKLHVRLALASDGRVERAEVVQALSAPQLVGGKLESCVLDSLKKEKFPAPRSGSDVTLEVPLEFRPPK
jgi:outer membrane biosynthesis protein TonB